MSITTESTFDAPSRPVDGPSVLSRRTALRLAFASLPLAAGLALPGISQAATARSSLVPGTYRPGSTTTGPVAGIALTTHNGDFTASKNGQVIQNLEVFGSINLLKFTNVIVRNCIVWGTSATGTDTSFIYGSWDDNRGLLIEDSRLIGRGNVWCSGMRGGNYTIRRTEITNTPDGLCLTSAAGNVTAEGCWIHNGLYKEWAAGTANMPQAGDYYTHTDGIQFHRGKNYTIRGNLIGGKRIPGLYPHTGAAAKISSADDMYNTAIMIKQEVDSSVANRIGNVLIEKNWLLGGMSTLNITSGRGNNFSTTIIRNNRFIRSTWGGQWYILRGAGLGVLSGNVFDDTGAAVAVTAGA